MSSTPRWPPTVPPDRRDGHPLPLSMATSRSRLSRSTTLVTTTTAAVQYGESLDAEELVITNPAPPAAVAPSVADLPLGLSTSDIASSRDRKLYARRVATAVECHALLHGWPELQAQYQIMGKLGEGTFSTVYKARDLCHDELQPVLGHKSKYVALKNIFPSSSEQRIVSEVRLLAELRGHPNIAGLVTLHRKEDRIVVVLPYFEHLDVKDYFRELPFAELRYYFASLMAALAFCHGKGIIHRDVKPSNFLYHPARRRGVLVDFGLAQQLPLHSTARPVPLSMSTGAASRRSDPGTSAAAVPINVENIPELGYGNKQIAMVLGDTRPHMSANRAGTRGFRPPEVLLKVKDQTPVIDVWAAGVTLLCFLTRRFPFFQSGDDVEALQELGVLFGTRRLKRMASKYQRVFVCKLPNITSEGVSWNDLIYTLNPHEWEELPSEAMDFLTQTMALNPSERITAASAVMHPWLIGVNPMGHSATSSRRM
ncbi:kinase-like domain-containing protein [Blastocladiella britannica]|nr:kinase-like domain-containing protein [Blastocladiella britannica]